MGLIIPRGGKKGTERWKLRGERAIRNQVIRRSGKKELGSKWSLAVDLSM
jgi:hypothetical protein